jgi:carbon-monoxide dehydrogenase small subunit
MIVNFELNGKEISCSIEANVTLLEMLRNKLRITSVKKGCEQGECGACTILLDGAPVNSCIVLAPRVEGRKITTIEGIKETPLMNTLRNAFAKGGAIQCGFCTPGMLLSSYALLQDNPKPTSDEIMTAIEGNICRCTGYVHIIRAIKGVASRI